MMIVGKYIKSQRFCVALVDALGIYTQGNTRPELYAAVKELVLDSIFGDEDDAPGFEVSITDDGSFIYITASDPTLLVAAVLREQRLVHQLSLADVVARLGLRNRTAYSLYETGKTDPTIGKLTALLAAVAPELSLCIAPRGAAIHLTQVATRKKRKPGPKPVKRRRVVA